MNEVTSFPIRCSRTVSKWRLSEAKRTNLEVSSLRQQHYTRIGILQRPPPYQELCDRVISNFRLLYSDRNPATVGLAPPSPASGGSGCQLIHIQLGSRNGVHRCRTTLDDQRLSGFPGSILSLPLPPLGTIVQAGEHTRPLYERMSYTFSASDFALRFLSRDRPLVASQSKHPATPHL